MTKYFCDCCGKEVKRPNRMDVPCHVAEEGDLGNGYVDNEFNAISGRSVGLELCNKCSNTFYYAGIKALEKEGFKKRSRN